MLTIYDLAKKCDLAPSTVSKVLNNYNGVSEKTKELVYKTAKEINYMPNQQARALTLNKSNNIGILILIREEYQGLKHDLFMSITQHFKRYVETKGYDITLISKLRTLYDESYLSHAKAKRMDGMLLFGDYQNKYLLEMLGSGMPIVAFDYLGDKATGVTCDNHEKVYDLTSHVIGLGHKKIAYITGDYNEMTEIRKNAFIKSLEDHKMNFDDIQIINGFYGNNEWSYNKSMELMTQENPPTCIMYPDDTSALAGYSSAYDLKLSIPGDISITGFDRNEYAKNVRPTITTVEQDTKAIGESLGKKLVKFIKNRELEPSITEIKAKIFYGESCASPKK